MSKEDYLPYLTEEMQKRIEKICGKDWTIEDIPSLWRRWIERGKVEKI